MEIEFIPCYSDRELFLKMARDYVKTLHEYDSEIVWDLLTWENAVWNAKFILEDRTIQGFIITEEVEYRMYNDLLYITELYIVPEARKKGIALGAIKEAVKGWGGDIFLYILDRNFEAKMFWTIVEEKLGWKRVERPEIRQERGCELRVYQGEKT